MSFGIYSHNLVDQAKLTASSENVNFPLANVKDYRRSKVFRSATNSDSIVLDFGETSEVNAFFIVPDKRNGFGITSITLEFNGTNSWDSPASTESVIFSTKHSVGFKEFDPKSYRFCRIVMQSTLGFCEISNIFLGKKLETERSINFNWTYLDNDLSRTVENRYGQKFVDIITRRKTINCSISYMDKDGLEQFFDAYDRCGQTKPLFIRLGCENMSDDYRRFSGMFYFSDIPSITNPFFNKYNVNLSLEEAT
jgi:hypothetical protein